MRLRTSLAASAFLIVMVLAAPVYGSEGDRGEEGQAVELTLLQYEVGASLPPPRGGLVLLGGEMLELTGPHQFSFVQLGNGSELVLEGCELSVTGDQFNDPFFEGSPSRLVIRNSTVDVIGLDAPGLYRTGGQNASFMVEVADRFELSSSRIDLLGGQGLGPVREGCYFTGRVSGTMFKGGNATFSLVLPDGSDCLVAGSTIGVLGGDGGDAPRGQDVLLLGSGRLPGGYTMGGDVCGEVGRGGTASMVLEGPSVDMIIDGSGLEVRGGAGAKAGDGGYLTSQLVVACDIPIPAGGYTAGSYSSGDSVLPGNVTDNVGMGGISNLRILARSLELSSSTLTSRGGDGGDSGLPGVGTYKGPTGTSYVRAGMGGGGYAGGASTPAGGQNGGKVLERVGSGGDAFLILDIGLELLTTDNGFSCQGGSGGVATEGGMSGCVESGTYPRGGGGGGGGYSGGGGGGLEAIGHSKQGGNYGYVGGRVGAGGNSTTMVTPVYSSGRDECLVVSSLGEAYAMEPLKGQDSVSRTTGEVLAHGGGGAMGNAYDGTNILSFSWPAPFLGEPRENGCLRDISQPFSWEPGSPSLGGPLYYRFRLLGSAETSDIIEESGLIADRHHHLTEDPGDGRYHWSVWVDGQLHDSVWARPRPVILDRAAPTLDAPSERVWLNGSSSILRIHAFDKVSGIVSGTAQYKVQKAGTVSMQWYDAEVERMVDGDHLLSAEVPSVEGDYEVYLRVSDIAGNGPVIGGPYLVSVDTTPPQVLDMAPTGWSNGEVMVSFGLMEAGSGPVDDVLIRGEGGVPRRSFEIPSGMLVEKDDRRSCTEALFLERGDWELTLSVMDMVGNKGSSDAFVLRVDRDPPLVTDASPSNGNWANRSRPAFAFMAKDLDSGPAEAVVEVIGPSGGKVGTFVAVMSPDGIWHSSPEEDLADGRYGWRVVMKDAVGNEQVSDLNDFGIDTTPPVIHSLSSWDVHEDRLALDLEPIEELSGLELIEVSSMLWAREGWEMGGTEVVSDLTPLSGGSVKAEIPVPRTKVAFVSVRGTDAAGSTGPWSEVFRLDIGEAGFSITSKEGPYLRTGEELDLLLYDEAGTDAGSIELIVRDGSGKASHPPFRTTVEGKMPLPSSDTTPHPVSVALSISTEGLSGATVIEAYWGSILPMEGRRYAAVEGPVLDAEAPELELEAPSHSTSNPYPILVKVNDRTSGVDTSSVAVEVGRGNTSVCNGRGCPRLEDTKDGEYLLHVNLTWGVMTEVSVRVRDIAGNMAEGLMAVKATRAPEVWITSESDLDGPFRSGDHLILEASSFDPDQEALTVLWAIDGSFAGNGTVLDLVLSEPSVNVTVTVSDGHHTAFDRVLIRVEGRDTGGERPFPMAIVLLSASAVVIVAMLAAAAVIFILVSKRRKDGEEEEAEDWGVGKDASKGVVPRAKESKVYSAPGSSKARCGAEVCSICLKGMSGRPVHPRCRCGASFHKACALREGVCPECGREIMLKAE